MKKIKSEKGSITLFALMSMIFFVIVLVGLYINSSNQIQKQEAELQQIQEQYTENIDDVYGRVLEDNVKLLTDVVDIGDYVKYEIDTVSTESLISNLTTYSGNTDTTKNTSTTITQETLNWRVLDIVKNEEGKNCVRLISETPTTSTITLEGYNGYNNAVYLIDETCDTLYNNSTYAENVQNLKIEDIEKYMKITDYSTINSNYGETYSPTNKYYPIILEQEANQIVNGETGKLGFSEQTALINQTAAQQVSSWTLMYTYWNRTMETTDFKDSIYYNLFINNSASNYSSYWISSRCISSDDNAAGFYVRIVNSGDVDATFLGRSGGSSLSITHTMRPVVTLKADILIDIEKSGDGSEVGKEYVLK